jgi:hypothetical protein
MSNKSTLLAWVNAQDESACAAAMELLGIAQPVDNGHDTPDANSAVLLTGLRPNHPKANSRVIVKEIVDALPDGHAKDIGNANLLYVNALNMFMGWEYSAARAGVTGTGAMAHIDPHSDNLPNVLVFAARDARTGAELHDTVQGATEYLNSLPDSAFGTPSGDGFHH